MLMGGSRVYIKDSNNLFLSIDAFQNDHEQFSITSQGVENTEEE